MANAPLAGRDGESYSLICISEKQKYFCGRGWTGHNQAASGGEVICPSGNRIEPFSPPSFRGAPTAPRKRGPTCEPGIHNPASWLLAWSTDTDQVPNS